MTRPSTIYAINRAVRHARTKHPRFVRNRVHLAGVLLEEVCECLWHVLRGNKKRAKEEALDTIAVLVRLVEKG